MFERQIYHLIGEIDDFVGALRLGAAEEIELHASVIHRGSERPWEAIPRRQREKLLVDALAVVARSHWSIRAFGVAVDKGAVAPADPVELAFEEICSRFNHFLTRLYNRSRSDADKRRGLVVMDRSHYEEALQSLARQFRVRGTRWGHLRNMAEVPLFVDSRAARIVQATDLVAYAIWRRYERKDTRFFDRIVAKFDHEGGVIHGLVHRRDPAAECHCPACLSRRRQLDLLE